MGTSPHNWKVIPVIRDDIFLSGHVNTCRTFWENIQELKLNKGKELDNVVNIKDYIAT